MKLPNTSGAPAVINKINDKSDLLLTARYRKLLLAVVLPLFIVVMVLAASQYRDQRAQVINDLAHNNATYTIALEGIAKDANTHVLQMKEWTENYLDHPPEYHSGLRKFFTPYLINGKLEGYTLDAVPENERELVGQLGWYSGDPREPEVGDIVLDQALEFFSMARLAHSISPYFRWSYFFSANKQFVALYPWASMDFFLKEGGYTSMREAMASWFEYELYTAGTPAHNPQHKPYWTEPYIDAGGSGAMVSHAVPVYVNEKFTGIVGTDLRLATLNQFLSTLSIDVGRLLIINDQQILLADTAAAKKNTIRKINEVLPSIINREKIDRAVHLSGDTLEIEGHALAAQKTSHAPWTLVYLVTDEEIDSLLLPRLMPYALILIALAITFFIAFYLMRKEFISPALALVKYLHEVSLDPSASEPQLPNLWQTWVNVVAQTFNSSRDTTRKLLESEERLKQVLNNSSAVVYVRDLDERFLLINKAFERLLGVTQDEIIGKHLDEVFPPDTAAEFRANDSQVIERNAVIEFEESVALNDGIHTYISGKFPLFDANGDIYATCGISTDITVRKQSEEILRQAALGISLAHGDDVFNSLTMHMSKSIGADFALIGVLEDNDEISTRALYAHGKIADNITYCLAGSPCQNVVGQQFQYYPDNIQQRFPEDDLLKEIDVESYAAIPLFDSKGKVLGLFAILDSKPLHNKTLVESILQIFAGRAASELEREQVDDALRASEASYRAIFEASEDAIFVHDLDTGKILDVNDKACRIYGYSYGEMLEATVGDLSSGTPPYTQEDAQRLIGRAVAGEQLNFEWHRKNRDGSLHWDEVFARRVAIAGIDRILVHTREITARKEAEEKLRASEQQYRSANRMLRESEAFKTSIVDNSLLGVITINEQGQVVEFNPAAVTMFGHDKKMAIGCDLAELIIPEKYRVDHRKGLANYLKTGEAQVMGKRLELSAMRADGSEFPIELSISVNRIGDINYFTAFIADLTDKKDAEAALRASAEQYQSIFNAASDAMILWDGEGHMVDANPAAWEMGGYTREEILSKPFKSHIHPSSHESYEQFKNDIATVKWAATETKAIRKDGTVIDLESRSIPTPYQGKPHILTISRDVTEQKKVAEELARQREALRQSEKLSAMGELLAGVAHELNNPLAILMGRAALLENKTTDPSMQEEVEKISAAAERCGRIVRTFLAMARQKMPERKPANINDVISSAIDLLGYNLRTSGIKLKTKLDKSLPKLNMDTDQIGQIIINLLVNAQHVLTEQPQPRLITLETGRSEDGIYCRISDNGPGIPTDVQQRIFDPFFTTKDKSKGTGIGLSVSLSISREHGGKLSYEDNEPGATFLLWLPLDSTPQDSKPNENLNLSNELRTEHVLIIDDEAELTELLAKILQSAGLQTTCLHSGKEAIKWLKDHTCDIILSDIRMPDMDGTAFWRALKLSHPELTSRIAFITGDTLSASIAPFLKETGQPWLEKPFTPEQVLELVARIETL